MEIRNIVIIAHVDHGKTTLVDALLKQTKTFRSNQKEMSETLIMDSNDLERERGITILAKNTSVFYPPSHTASEGRATTKINIIDTPGHADFGGEVERTITMASGAILLVDAAEGPLPQTKFVLKKALEAGLKIVLVINKIDKRDARPIEIISEIETLFLDLAQDDSSLEFTTLFAVGRDGKAFYELPEKYTAEDPGDLTPLFDTILKEFPNVAMNEDKPLQMQISTLDYDNYVGKLCIGKITQGTLKQDQNIAVVGENDKVIGTNRVAKLYTTSGLDRVEVDHAVAGDIATIAGIPILTIGQTVCDPAFPQSMPHITVEDPTIKISVGPNTSPFGGKEGKFSTSRQLRERLYKEVETNLGLRVQDDTEGVGFIVSGRGELHLAVLLEEMRRGGYEMEVSKPQVIYKTINGEICEPFEEVTIEVEEQYFGVISEEMGKRKATMLDMKKEGGNQNRIVYRIASQNLLGIRNSLLTKTRGTAILHSFFLGYFPKGLRMDDTRNGSLVSVKGGEAANYAIGKVQARGTLFVGHGDVVYEGMVVGAANKMDDIEVNVSKEKQLTNNRSAGEGVSVGVIPPTRLTLEQSLDFINDDELLEITPISLRIRKRVLTSTLRKVNDRRMRQIRESQQQKSA